MNHRLSQRRVPLAIVVGVFMGAALVSGFLSLPVLISVPLDEAIWLFCLAFVVAGFCWLAGLAFIAVPCWIALHRMRRRGPKDAAVLGAALTFCVSIVLSLFMSEGTQLSIVDGRASIIDGERTLYGWRSLIQGAALLSIAGVAVAVAVWWISYPRVKPPPAPPV